MTFNCQVKCICKVSGGRFKLYICPCSRGSSIPGCARPVGTLPSFRARCAMAARCLCFATASRIPSKPSSALPVMRTDCSRVGAAANEDVQCLNQHPHVTGTWTGTAAGGGELQHSSIPLPQPLLVRNTFVIIKKKQPSFDYVALLLFVSCQTSSLDWLYMIGSILGDLSGSRPESVTCGKHKLVI